MTDNITFISVLLAGFFSFISPCVLPLVPPYLCYLAGVSLDQLTDEGASRDLVERRHVQRRVLINAMIFVLGFATVFISLGAAASTVGQFVQSHLVLLSKIAGLVIIFMGLHFLGLLKIGVLYREFRFQAGGAEVSLPGDAATSATASAGGSYLMGLAFAFGWTPCIGPILGAILAVAGSRDSVGEGAFLLGLYSLGLGIPFMLAAAFINPFMNFLSRFRRHLGMVEKVMGILLIVTGILFLTGDMQTMSYWLVERLPVIESFADLKAWWNSLFAE